jgi:hypothetical protein
MQLFPAAPSTQAVLGLLPLSGTADFKASAVYKDTYSGSHFNLCEINIIKCIFLF